VTPNDGKADGLTINSATITVSDVTNTPPVASNLAITPTSPVTGDNLVASYSYFDADGHPEYNSIISWYKNGVFNVTTPSLTLPAAYTAKGEVWTFSVTPYDGFDYGSVVISGPVTIGNTAPSFTSLVILPNPAFGSSTLTATPSGFVDADGDVEGYTYQWQKKVADTYQNIDGATSKTLGSVNFAPTDWIRVQVTAFDGTDVGNTLLFETQIVDSGAPTTGTPLLVSGSGSNRDDDELICTAVNSQDPDGDSVINVFNWFRGGTSFTNLYLPFESNSLTTANDYSGYNNDGVVSGASWISQGVIGGGYSFAGSSSNHHVITVADSVSLGSDGSWSEMTVEYWVNPSVDQRGARILNKNGGAAGTSGKYMTGINTDAAGPANVIFFGVTIGTSYQETYSNTDSVVATGSWSHVVGTYKSGEGLKLYINGVLQSSNLGLSGNVAASVGEPLLIGYASTVAGTANRYFKGSLDEIRIYPSALSDAQIFQNFVDQRDGFSDSATVVPQETVNGQTWRCQVTPNDGWQNGVPALSNELTIGSANTRPRIDYYTPVDAVQQLYLGQSLNFMTIASDPNASPLTFEWTLDSVIQTGAVTNALNSSWTYSPTTASSQTVRVEVSDGTTTVYREWTVNVGTPYTLTVNTVGEGSVTLNPVGGYYVEGTTVQLTAVPAAGWSFSAWSGDATGSTNPTSIVIDSDKTVTASFTQNEYTLGISTVGSGLVSKNPDQASYHYGDLVTLTATPSSDWSFVGWSGALTSTTNPVQVTITGDTAITATFTDQNILTVNTVGSGSVTKSPNQPFYADGTNVELEAVAAAGWSFSGWSGALTGNVNPASITMDTSKTVTATFSQDQYTLTINLIGAGSVTKNPNLSTYTYGTEVDLNSICCCWLEL
jgi:uncharacterized repeat protein (TIGR02543 family)